MPTRNNPDHNPARDDVVNDDAGRADVDDTTAPAERDAGGGFYADSPSDGPNRRGPDTDGDNTGK